MQLSITYDNTAYTIYSRDASGNVMATYQAQADEVSHSDLTKAKDIEELYISEHHLYGSSRLGIRMSALSDIDLATGHSPSTAAAEHHRGLRQYELTNHLGNVLSSVSDHRLLSGQGTPAYVADIISYSDYYPFGWQMPDRNDSNDGYRYGYNGKEKDDGIKGSGVQYDYGFRIYDAKFLSVDPLADQIEIQMKALAKQKNLSGNRKATEDGAAFYTLVTYSDVGISKDFIDLANKLDIHLYHIKAYFSDKTGSVDFSPFERLSSNSLWENLSSIGEDVEELFTADSFMHFLYKFHKPVPFDWDDANKNAGLSNEKAFDFNRP